MFKNIKQNIKNKITEFKREHRLNSTKTFYVSFGENCLSDKILERHSLKLITTPFSHGRSNIEYILNLEKDNYKDFLNVEYLKHEDLNGKKVTRLKKYDKIANDYNELHKNGFEFTHHDVINNDEVRSIIDKRLKFLQKNKGKKRFIIFYHHRVHNGTDMGLLTNNLLELKRLYTRNEIQSEIVCFTQRIVKDVEQREVEYLKKSNIHFFNFLTLHIWEGVDDDIFWARCDEDLISKMIKVVKNI